MTEVAQPFSNLQGAGCPTRRFYVWGLCYRYDANGQRVHRTGVTTATADCVYDLASHWILEINNAATQCKSEIYAGGRHYVTDVDGQTYFDHSD